MPAKPLITTVLTTYRRPKLLRRAIRSALNQSIPDLLVSVYDDASGDETGDVVRDLTRSDSRVRYYEHPQNIGAPRNWDYGLRSVQTPFFSMLSDDDVLLPEFYERALDQFRQYPEAMVAIGDTLYFGPNYEPYGRSTTVFEERFYRQPAGLLAMSMHPQPSWTGMLFRREVLDVVGGLDTELFSMDYDFVLRVAAVCPYTVFHEPAALFSVHSQQSTATLRLHMVWPTRYAALRKVASDDRIPANVRQRVEEALTSDFGRLLVFIGLRTLTLGEDSECRDIIHVLRELKMRRAALLLGSVYRAVRMNEACRRLLVSLHRSRRNYVISHASSQMAKVRHYAWYYNHYA
jgi:glycosyltransferase involved in cell wall biosynthesis